jgi:heme/copper-type cytochrome/quinol oxidase subunit 3
MLTGLHAAHVVGGIALLAIVAARSFRGRYGSGHHPGITYAAMYVHFLDGIWLVLFAVLVVFA